MIPHNAIAALEQLFGCCDSPEWTVGETFRLRVRSKPVSFSILEELRTIGLMPAIEDPPLQLALDKKEPGEVRAGVTIQFDVPRKLNGFLVARSIEDILSIQKAQVQEPSAYIIIDKKLENGFFAHVAGASLGEASTEIKRYHQALGLWDILRKNAQHVQTSNDSLLYFGIRRTEIKPGFELADLSNDIAVDDIKAFVDETDRKQTREEIFEAVLSEFLRDQQSDNAFRWILRGSVTFARRLKEGMAIYLSENSPEKLAAQATDAAFALSEKLEKAIGGLEAKSLSIPAAVLLAVKEVDLGEGFTTLNWIIFLSALTYAITMTFVHTSQKEVIEVLRDSIRKTDHEFKDKGLDASNPVLSSTFASLIRRSEIALWSSLVMFAFSWAPLIAVWIAMLQISPIKSRVDGSQDIYHKTLEYSDFKAARKASKRRLETTSNPEKAYYSSGSSFSVYYGAFFKSLTTGAEKSH